MWQSQSFLMRLLRPFRARNYIKGISNPDFSIKQLGDNAK